MKPGLIAPEDPLDSCGSPESVAPSAKRAGKSSRDVRRERRRELAELKRELVKGDNAVAFTFLCALVSLVWFGGGWLGWIPWFDRTSWSNDPTRLWAAGAGLVVLLIVQGWSVGTYRRDPWIPSLFTVLVASALAALWIESVGIVWMISLATLLPSLGSELWSLYQRESRTQPLEAEGALLDRPVLRRHKFEVENALAKARSGPSKELVATAGTLLIVAIALVFRLATS